MPDQLRRPRSPLQLALGGVLVVLILVVEVLILQAYVNAAPQRRRGHVRGQGPGARSRG